ncbi:hypothetical protein AVEN_13961-1 [Araneus ventricosus]|uniref:Tc1-like transposase DDE domain-containing protein n=1 Tax=Araneus ventricosus TaxID=182803 RepID=A0A4Y2K1C9_ARAVE|nr:hypothetical protein AVEN_13961-1 [Araneus ventricosus]
MLSEWLFPQLEEAHPGFILQLDGAPSHWHNNVREYLSNRVGANDLSLLCWQARSSDRTLCGFFLWGFVKDKVFVLPLPQELQELKQWINNVLNALTGDLLS